MRRKRLKAEKWQKNFFGTLSQQQCVQGNVFEELNSSRWWSWEIVFFAVNLCLTVKKSLKQKCR